MSSLGFTTRVKGFCTIIVPLLFLFDFREKLWEEIWFSTTEMMLKDQQNI